MTSMFEAMNPKNLSILFVTILTLIGCANIKDYNPIASATHQRFLLNESALAQLKVGMPQEQVHRLMGESILIGYSNQEKITINNPYKKEEITKNQKKYLVEYYVFAINQPDGIVSDDELIPLVFEQSSLLGKGKDFLKNLR